MTADIDLFENPDTAALRIDSFQNVVNSTARVPKEGYYWNTVYDFDIIESYKQSEIYLACRIVMNREDAQFDLLIRAIPHRHNRQADGSGSQAERNAGTEYQSSAANAEQRVFIGVVDFVQGPEATIPSEVWLEGPNERLDFMRKLFGPTHRASFEVFGSAGKREHRLSKARPTDAVCDGYGMTSVVESGSQVMGGFYGQMSDVVWDRLVKSELVNFLIGAIRVRLYKKCVWFGCEESSRFDFDVGSVLICASDL